MPNNFTPPVWIKALPHTSAEKQVGDADPQSRPDVINRPAKGLWANLQRVVNTLLDGVTLDASDPDDTSALPGAALKLTVPALPRVIGLWAKNNPTTPATKFDISVFGATFFNPTTLFNGLKWNPGTITNDITLDNTNPNGRDQAGAFSADSWVHFYLVLTDSGTVRSRSSATAPPGGPTLQAGEVAWVYVGTVRLDASANLLAVFIQGSQVYYRGFQSALTGGGATSETAVSLASFVPPNALAARIGFIGDVTINGAASRIVTLRLVSGVDLTSITVTEPNNPAASNHEHTTLDIPNINQQLYYLWNGTGATLGITVHGYTLPN